MRQPWTARKALRLGRRLLGASLVALRQWIDVRASLSGCFRFGALALEILNARRRLTAAGLRSHYILPLLREIPELRLTARISGE